MSGRGAWLLSRRGCGRAGERADAQRADGQRADGQRGSMAAEFTVIAPAFALLLLLLSAGGQWVSVTGQVGGAARDAARAASLARSPVQAQAQAQQAANSDLAGVCTGDAGTVPQVTVSAVTSGALAPFETAQDVQVNVACTVGLAAFELVGFPAHQTFSAAGVAPLDPFVCRSGAC